MTGIPVPDDWSRAPLRCLATINYGRDPSSILDADGPYPVYGTSGTDRQGIDYLYEGDSIILGRKGTIDRVKFASGRFWTIDTAYYLSNFADNLPKWLYYFLCRLDLRGMNEATGVPSLSRALLYEIPVVVPPVPEQSKIAEVLATVDRAIEQTEALIAKQQRIKTGLMQDLLTRGIDENGNLRSEETHEFKDSPLGRIPVEWDAKTVGTVISEIDAGWSPSCTDEMPAEGEWGVLKVSSVSSGVYTPSESKRLPSLLTPVELIEVKVGDVLMTRSNGVADLVGKCVLVKRTPQRLMLSDKTLRLCPSAKEITPFVLFATLSSHTSRLQILASLNGSSGQKNISQEQIRSIRLRVPLVDEQERIERVLESQIARISRSVAHLRKLRSLKTALMQDLLTGKVRVTPLLNAKGDVNNG